MHAVADGQCSVRTAHHIPSITARAAQVNAQRWIQYTLFHLKFIALLFCSLCVDVSNGPNERPREARKRVLGWHKIWCTKPNRTKPYKVSDYHFSSKTNLCLLVQCPIFFFISFSFHTYTSCAPCNKFMKCHFLRCLSLFDPFAFIAYFVFILICCLYFYFQNKKN